MKGGNMNFEQIDNLTDILTDRICEVIEELAENEKKLNSEHDLQINNIKTVIMLAAKILEKHIEMLNMLYTKLNIIIKYLYM